MDVSTRWHRLLTSAATVGLIAAAATSCAGGVDQQSADRGPGSASGSVPGSPSGSAEHNDADVAFATQMIPHHAQALSMADLAVGRQVDPEFSALLEDIRGAQTPEIERMADWLQEWGEPVPDTMRDHAHGGHGDQLPQMPDGHEMAGMMTADEMEELASASSAEFEELWLESMIEHHEGAVSMAEAEIDAGSYEPAVELAEQIAASQSEEIRRMQEMVAD